MLWLKSFTWSDPTNPRDVSSFTGEEEMATPSALRRRTSRRGSSARAFFAAACSLLGIAALTLGLLVAYASRALFNSEAFADRVAASLADPDVSAFVARRATEGLIARQRDLTAFEPLIAATMRSLIASEPFRGVVRRAARLSHETIMSGRARRMALNLADLGVILRSAVSTNPELANRIPPRISALVGDSDEAPGGRIALDAMRIAGRSRLSALALLILGTGLSVVGIVLSPARRMSLFRLGLSLALVALVLRLTVRFGGEILAYAARDPEVGRAAAGVWHAFLDGFMTWALVLGGIGLVLAAAVNSLFESVNLAEMGSSVRRWLAIPPASAGIWLLRSLALVLAGGLISLAPGASLTVAAFLAGLVLFFFGVRELFRLLMRALPEVELPRDTAGVFVAEESGSRPARAIAVGAAAAVLVGLGLFFLTRSAAEAEVPQTIDACNGYPELCGRRLNEVVFPATHNSMSAADIPDWLFPNQERSIPGQLQDGIRAFLIDAHYGAPAGDRVKTLLDNELAARSKYEAVLGKEGIDAAMRIRDRLVGADEGERGVYLCHGFCELGSSALIPMLRQVREFLVMNPGEVLMIVIQDEGVTPRDVEAGFEESGLIDFVYRGRVARPWPTLRDMIAGDQRVLVFAENVSAGVSWYHQAYEYMQETPYTFHKPEDFSCRPNRGGTSGSLFLLNHWIETAPAPLPSNARRVNAYDFLLQRARRCQKERGHLPNLIAVDFYRTGDVLAVARTLNGITAPVSSAGKASPGTGPTSVAGRR